MGSIVIIIYIITMRMGSVIHNALLRIKELYDVGLLIEVEIYFKYK